MLKSLFILATLIFALTASMEIAEEDDVLILTDDNFQHAIDSNEFILVEFYAPWCGHCKKLTPEYSRAAKILKALEKPVPLAKVDATEQKVCSAKFDIKGFPTLKFFNNGNAIEYNGGRVEKDIIAWVTKRTGDISQNLVDEAALNSFLEENKLAVVFFAESTSGDKWDAFKSVAMGYDRIAFAHSTVEALAKAKDSSLGNLVLFKNFDEKRNDYSGEFTSVAIIAWVDSNKVATVMEFDETAIEFVFQKSTPTIFIFHNDKEDSLAARKEFDSVAAEYKGVAGTVKFCQIQPDNQHWQRLADYIGINTAVIPSVMIVKAAQEVEKYKFGSKEFTAAAYKAFISEYTEGKLSVHVKSEDMPEDNDKPVKVIVGKNFQDIVINNDKDILVKFYAPWCGHCKTLIPHWQEAAEKLEKVNSNIVIAHCDSTQNEIAGVEIKGFPTLKFWAGNDKTKTIDFNGDRTTEGILTWLKENTTHPWVEVEVTQEEVVQQEKEEENVETAETQKDDL